MKFNVDEDRLRRLNEAYQKMKEEIGHVIIGQADTVDKVLTGIFSQGHCLLIGVPGLAKTLLVNTVARVLGISFSRIQFTPDLMPSDIIGTEILDESRKFRFIKGPVFANIILADEINRTPPKTQSALLEAMQEKAVTVAGNTYRLESPFFVLATQNPIEQEGTYPLPEAQLDRFMFNILLDYPSLSEEIKIVEFTTGGGLPEPERVLTAEEIINFQNFIRSLPVMPAMYEYAVKLARSSRPESADAHPWARKYITWGAGPRASQYLVLGAKCHGALNGRPSPVMEDLKAVAHAVLRHRIVRNYKAEAEGITVDDIIAELLKA
ncbi:MAG: MoxR-like ATPase [Bacteroidales bacterium]|jgi:MoxR-like ATPase|nr:MoxR-like ATPase [Bacteroidales bacterium]